MVLIVFANSILLSAIWLTARASRCCKEAAALDIAAEGAVNSVVDTASVLALDSIILIVLMVFANSILLSAI